MKTINVIEKLKSSLNAQWIVCRTISDKKSVQYGIRFSYPIYLLIVFSGVFLENIYILLIAAFIALLSIKLPMHPFDYIFNYTFAKLKNVQKIPGRGSELQVNSNVALVFCLVVIMLIILSILINYSILAIIYLLISVFLLYSFLIK